MKAPLNSCKSQFFDASPAGFFLQGRPWAAVLVQAFLALKSFQRGEIWGKFAARWPSIGVWWMTWWLDGKKGVIVHWWWWWIVVEWEFLSEFYVFFLLLVIPWDCWSDWMWFTGIERWEKTMVYQHGQSNMAGKTSMNIRWKNPSHVGLPASRVWIDVNEMSPYRTCHTEIHPQFGFGNQRKDDIIPIAFGFWQHIEFLSFAKQM